MCGTSCTTFVAADAEPPTLAAELRGSAGTIASTKLRRGGKTPGIVFSGPGGEEQLLAFESKALARLVTKLGRTAWACSVFNLQIEGEGGSSQTVRALVRAAAMLHRLFCCVRCSALSPWLPTYLPGRQASLLAAMHAACPQRALPSFRHRDSGCSLAAGPPAEALRQHAHAHLLRACGLQGRQVHMRADTDAIENVTFIYCPPERQVRVDVPLKVSLATPPPCTQSLIPFLPARTRGCTDTCGGCTGMPLPRRVRNSHTRRRRGWHSSVPGHAARTRSHAPRQVAGPPTGSAALLHGKLVTAPCRQPALQVIGDDVSPGVKAGGRVNWIKRTIPCIARGDAIPSDFTVDIRCGVCRAPAFLPWPLRVASLAGQVHRVHWAWSPGCKPSRFARLQVLGASGASLPHLHLCLLLPHMQRSLPLRSCCSKMGMNDKLAFTDLVLPEGARLHHSVDPSLPILKVAK